MGDLGYMEPMKLWHRTPGHNLSRDLKVMNSDPDFRKMAEFGVKSGSIDVLVEASKKVANDDVDAYQESSGDDEYVPSNGDSKALEEFF